MTERLKVRMIAFVTNRLPITSLALWPRAVRSMLKESCIEPPLRPVRVGLFRCLFAFSAYLSSPFRQRLQYRPSKTARVWSLALVLLFVAVARPALCHIIA